MWLREACVLLLVTNKDRNECYCNYIHPLGAGMVGSMPMEETYSKTNVYITGLAPTVTDEELINMFSEYAPAGCACIAFKEPLLLWAWHTLHSERSLSKHVLARAPFVLRSDDSGLQRYFQRKQYSVGSSRWVIACNVF